MSPSIIRSLCLVLLLGGGILPSVLPAQGRIVFQEEFEANSRNWEEQETRKLTARIQAGAYYLKARSKASPNYFGKPISLDPGKDFKLEIKFTQTKGAKNMGVGLSWGAGKSQQDGFAFLVSTNGKYTILRKQRGQYSEIKPWTASAFVGKKKEPNVLTVLRQGNEWLYFLNETRVFASAHEPWKGTEIGILFHGTMELEVDYLLLQEVE
jgi:hypothetical protein